jgi:hypothetical protein
MTYHIVVGSGVRMAFSADFVEVSHLNLLEGEATEFQVADARHRPSEVA